MGDQALGLLTQVRTTAAAVSLGSGSSRTPSCCGDEASEGSSVPWVCGAFLPASPSWSWVSSGYPPSPSPPASVCLVPFPHQGPPSRCPASALQTWGSKDPDERGCGPLHSGPAPAPLPTPRPTRVPIWRQCPGAMAHLSPRYPPGSMPCSAPSRLSTWQDSQKTPASADGRCGLLGSSCHLF